MASPPSRQRPSRERSQTRGRNDPRPVLTPRHRERALPVAPEPAGGSIIERYPTKAPVTVSIESVVTGDNAEKLWETYRANFAPLAELAMLQHMFPREEILAELANPRIQKIVGWEGADPVGLGMVTNHLESVPQISPDFLRGRYPDHAARDAIYYGILVAVSQQHRGLTLFNRLYTELWQIAALDGGVLAFDICQFNREAFDTDALTARIASSFPDSSISTVDQQTWYLAELPTPITRAG